MSNWVYGYYDKNNEFIVTDGSYVGNYHRFILLNKATGQSLPYAPKDKGQPGVNTTQAKKGVTSILEFLNGGIRGGKGEKFLKNFIKNNGGESVWENYSPYTGKIPPGIPKGNLTAGVPQDAEGNYLNHNTGEYITETEYYEQFYGINEDGTPVVDEVSDGENPHEDALNEYYKDLYSLKKGTSGDEMYRRLTDVYANQATVAGSIAEAQYQQQAMQQAQVVKQIADQVRSERMARLRAGMSEAQIANQDMQTMMTNVQALNTNAAQLNQSRLEATGAYLTAQDQAYMDYLNQSNVRGQVAMAGSAADAGNAYFLAQRYMANNPGTSFSTAYNIVTGQQQQKK